MEEMQAQTDAANSASGSKPDIESIMSDIRARIHADVEPDSGRITSYSPKAEGPFPQSIRPLLYSDELNYLNANWGKWGSLGEITSHRKYIGPVIVAAKKALRKVIWHAFLKDYLEAERHYHSHLLRYLNETARYIDARDSEIFWQIVHKVDNDILGMNERADRLYDEATSTLRSVELSLTEQSNKTQADLFAHQGKLTHLLNQITTIDTVVRGLERTISLISKVEKREIVIDKPEDQAVVDKDQSDPGSWPLGTSGVEYLLLENRYRGSEELIAERMADYVDYFRDSNAPVVEFGCGRGEFLELLRQNEINAIGVDIDPAMIARCKEKNLDVVLQDCLGYLEAQEDKSIGGIFAAQLIEHLQREDLERLIVLASKKLVPGAPILLETINPQSFVALACNFFRDPTHVWPIHPDTMRFIMEMKGIATEEVLMRSEFPSEATLQTFELEDYLPARWKNSISVMNDNIIRLNNLLYGYQDFCIVGRA